MFQLGLAARRTLLVSAFALAAGAAYAETPAALPSFADVVERVKPAVVSVKVNVEEATEAADVNVPDEMPPEMREFFKRFGGGNPHFNKPGPHKGVALGSGFIISADGYVVTNNHVVEHGGKSVAVTLDNGKELKAKVIGTDAKTDLAVLKIEDSGDYPHVNFAKGLPRIGDWVLAIGNPFGLGGSVTAGIVSAEGRDIGSGPYDQFIQIDAPINKGNSGGPTFNLAGEVVGVNTAIFSPTGGSVGLGFAIPAQTVETIVSQLEHGGVQRGYLGVEIQPVNQDIADSLGLKSAEGALIAQTQPDTPAAGAGLRSGDVVVKFNGETVTSAADLTRKVGALKPGVKAKLTYVREGEEQTTDVTLGALPGEKTAMIEEKPEFSLGLQLRENDKGKGVAVVGVDPDGAAASKGVSAGDVILEVAGKPVTSPVQVRAEIDTARKAGKKAVLLLVKSQQGAHFVAFNLPKA